MNSAVVFALMRIDSQLFAPIGITIGINRHLREDAVCHVLKGSEVTNVETHAGMGGPPLPRVTSQRCEHGPASGASRRSRRKPCAFVVPVSCLCYAAERLREHGAVEYPQTDEPKSVSCNVGIRMAECGNLIDGSAGLYVRSGT